MVANELTDGKAVLAIQPDSLIVAREDMQLGGVDASIVQLLEQTLPIAFSIYLFT